MASYHTRFPEIIMALDPHMDAAMLRGAELVKERAQARVPRDTGRLHDAIHLDRLSDGSGYAVVAGDNDAFYGHIVEHGGAYNAPHPFMLPSAEESRDEVVRFGIEALATL